MKSTSHKSLFTGILDMNGNRILNGSKVYIHDRVERDPYKANNKGTIAWKRGSYVIQGGLSDGYNVYAWRKKIEVLQPKTKPVFIKEDFDSAWLEYSRSIPFTEPSRKEIRRAFKFAYESKIENE